MSAHATAELELELESMRKRLRALTREAIKSNAFSVELGPIENGLHAFFMAASDAVTDIRRHRRELQKAGK